MNWSGNVLHYRERYQVCRDFTALEYTLVTRCYLYTRIQLCEYFREH